MSIFAGAYPTVASGYVDGIGTNARFNTLNSIAISADGSFAIFAEEGNDVIRNVALLLPPTSTPTFSPSLMPSISIQPTRPPTMFPTLISESYGFVSLLAGAFPKPGPGYTNGIGTDVKFNSPNGVAVS